MEKIIKHFVQKLYPGFPFSESTEEEIESRDPMMVEDDGRMLGFRFYDQEFVVDGDKVFTGEEFNYSNWIFFGKRMSALEVEEMYKYKSDKQILIGNIKNNGIEFVCYTRISTFLPMDDGDLTCEEYLEQKDNKTLTLEQ